MSLDFFPITNNSQATPGLFNRLYQSTGLRLTWFGGSTASTNGSDYYEDSLNSALSFIINTSIPAGGTNTLYIDPGIYNLSRPIAVPVDVRLEGVGQPEFFFDHSCTTGGFQLGFGSRLNGLLLTALPDSSFSKLAVSCNVGQNTVERCEFDGFNVNLEIASGSLAETPNCTIQDNRFNQTYGTHPKGRGIVLNGATGAQIRNNQILANPVAGVYIGGNTGTVAAGMSVVGNYFTLPFVSGSNASSTRGVQVVTNLTAPIIGLSVDNNVFLATTLASNQSIYGVTLEGAIQDSAVVANLFRGTTKAAVYLASTETEANLNNAVVGNNFSLTTGWNVENLGSSGASTGPQRLVSEGNATNFPGSYRATSSFIPLPGPIFFGTAPATGTSRGEIGTMVMGGGFLYICLSANSWSRTTLTGF